MYKYSYSSVESRRKFVNVSQISSWQCKVPTTASFIYCSIVNDVYIWQAMTYHLAWETHPSFIQLDFLKFYVAFGLECLGKLFGVWRGVIWSSSLWTIESGQILQLDICYGDSVKVCYPIENRILDWKVGFALGMDITERGAVLYNKEQAIAGVSSSLALGLFFNIFACILFVNEG